EGRTTGEIQQARPGWELFRDGCPNGESPAQVAVRMDELIGKLHADNPSDVDILVFGHGHCLRALATRYLHLPIEEAGVLRLDAGSLSILGHEHDHRALTLWNRPPEPLPPVGAERDNPAVGDRRSVPHSPLGG